MKSIVVVVEDRPGTFAAICETLGKANIDIEGHCGYPCKGISLAHFLVEDVITARRVLEEEGIDVVREKEVIILELKDKPGMLGKAARKIANAGINLGITYLAKNNRIVLETEDLDKALNALK